jgi:anti-anti-sigma regulatory factor
MAIDVDTREGIRYIRLTHALDITQAAELKCALMDAIAISPRVCIEIARASAIDATIVQLLWAAISHGKSVGCDLVLHGPVSEAVERTLLGTGIFPLMSSLLVGSEEEAASGRFSRR